MAPEIFKKRLDEQLEVLILDVRVDARREREGRGSRSVMMISRIRSTIQAERVYKAWVYGSCDEGEAAREADS